MDITRRQMMLALASLPALTIPQIALSKDSASGKNSRLIAYVGCRTTKQRNARGKGINVYHVDQRSGEWTHVQLVEGIDNPSFLAFDQSKRYLYSVHGDLSDISAYAIDPLDGKLTLINRQSTEGKNPVHLAPDVTNRFMVVANYATGTVASLPINQDGSLGSVVDLVPLAGAPGPHKTQQGSSHPHDVPFDLGGKYFIVPDKGLDRIFAFSINPKSGKFQAAPSPSVGAREGAAPRHVSFHPQKRLAYVINELDSTITTYRYSATTGELSPLQIVSTVPSDYTGDNTGAEIAVAKSGKFVFASNRGHDSIVTLAINPVTGLLTPTHWINSLGKGPRFFALDPNDETLYAANENSDSIVGFRINQKTGKLVPTRKIINTGSPVCIVFHS